MHLKYGQITPSNTEIERNKRKEILNFVNKRSTHYFVLCVFINQQKRLVNEAKDSFNIKAREMTPVVLRPYVIKQCYVRL